MKMRIFLVLVIALVINIAYSQKSLDFEFGVATYYNESTLSSQSLTANVPDRFALSSSFYGRLVYNFKNGISYILDYDKVTHISRFSIFETPMVHERRNPTIQDAENIFHRLFFGVGLNLLANERFELGLNLGPTTSFHQWSDEDQVFNNAAEVGDIFNNGTTWYLRYDMIRLAATVQGFEWRNELDFKFIINDNLKLIGRAFIEIGIDTKTTYEVYYILTPMPEISLRDPRIDPIEIDNGFITNKGTRFGASIGLCYTLPLKSSNHRR